jgi:hypothetical protein
MPRDPRTHESLALRKGRPETLRTTFTEADDDEDPFEWMRPLSARIARDEARRDARYDDPRLP